MMERTLGIIKPDGVSSNLIGAIIQRIESHGLRVVALKRVHLTRGEARGFYIVHQSRPFYDSLTAFMSEGPVVLMALEGEGAIGEWRDLMGATDPAKAADGTIRKDFAGSIERNVVHGSDSPESARFEIGYFFNALEICN